MRYWRDQGVTAGKLNLGFATYGQTFHLSTSNNGVGAPSSGPADEGCYTMENNIWSYYEVKLCTGFFFP